jgi:hypothetical protein
MMFRLLVIPMESFDLYRHTGQVAQNDIVCFRKSNLYELLHNNIPPKFLQMGTDEA